MKVYQITEVTGGATCTEIDPEAVADLLCDADTGSEYRVKVVEMTNEQYDALPEFEGF